MQEKVEQALERIRNFLRADGGDVEVIEVSDGVVKLRLTGACGGCPMSTLTLKNVVERVIKEQLPEIKEVIAL
jgi:Fe-S cluster biogenesis protein NfuA